MNKSKMMTVAVLACALMLGSCVDDKESASVESIRTAKAAQLNALASYNTALAEAALITAKADALVKEAEAAATAETTAEQKQKFELQLEQLKAEAALAVAKANKAALEAKQEMQKNTEQHILTLFGNYQTANATLASLNNDLLGEQVSLIAAQAGLADWKVQKADEILGCNTEIAKQEAIKKALNALPANNIDAAKAAAEANKTAKKGITDRQAVANSNLIKASNAYKDAKDAIDETETAKQITYLKDNYPAFLKTVSVTIDTLEKTRAFDTYTVYDKLINAELIRLKEASYQFDEQLGKIDGSETGTLNYNLVEAKKAESDAKKENDKVGATAADRLAYAAAQEATQAAQNAVDKNREDKAKSLEKYNELMTAQSAFAGNSLNAYNKAIAIARNAAIGEILAEIALKPINDELDTNMATQGVLDAVANGLADIKDLISKCDVAISAQQKAITIAEGISDKDQLVAYTNEKISNLKAEIANQQLIVTNFKVQLDAALAN